MRTVAMVVAVVALVASGSANARPEGGPGGLRGPSEECKTLVQTTCPDCTSFPPSDTCKACVEANLEALGTCAPKKPENNGDKTRGPSRPDNSACKALVQSTCPDCTSMPPSDACKACVEANVEALGTCAPKKPENKGDRTRGPSRPDHSACKALVQSTCPDCTSMPPSDACKTCIEANVEALGTCAPKKPESRGDKTRNPSKPDRSACKALVQATCVDCASKPANEACKSCIVANAEALGTCAPKKGGGDRTKGPSRNGQGEPKGPITEECKALIQTTCPDCTSMPPSDACKTCVEANLEALGSCAPKKRGGDQPKKPKLAL